ncbi:type II toxin-antitoxin system RelE family toxin [Lactiplantibacillus plajomi]|uniref:Type II toxin-antitoxin system RelE/ParE family toxin n=1 Tax=Lactiplantibacillus plajomi TaxID=1457217 RepID=A0ABV6K6H6_9LACO|nr:type II toxin-antitoxin system RelE/ParE family toxin [Lactiplantibacillus plajomi]
MKYTWSFNQKAFKDFKTNFDKPVQIGIIKWLGSHIEGADNPRIWGKALKGEFSTLWRYRVGSYRIIADIQDGIFLVEVIKAGKRNDVYKQK